MDVTGRADERRVIIDRTGHKMWPVFESTAIKRLTDEENGNNPVHVIGLVAISHGLALN